MRLLFLSVLGFSVVGFSGCMSPVYTTGGVNMNRPVAGSPTVAPEAPAEPVRAHYAPAASLRAVGVDAEKAPEKWAYTADDPHQGLVARPVAATRLKPAQERVIYYGASKEGAALLAPGREYIKVQESSFDDRDSLVEDAPLMVQVPKGGVDGRAELPTAKDSKLVSAFAPVAGRGDLSPVPLKRVLSGSTAPVDGFFQPLGFLDDSLAGRHQAQGYLDAHESAFPVKGDLLFEPGLGWGFFIPLEKL